MEALDALRRRDMRLVIEFSSVRAGAASLEKVGGLMSSWVLVSERRIVKGGGDWGRGEGESTAGVTSSLIFSFFLRRSFSVMLTGGEIIVY